MHKQNSSTIILHFVECDIIFIAQGKMILHEAMLSAIKMILYKTKCNIYFIINLLCIYFIRQFAKLMTKNKLAN